MVNSRADNIKSDYMKKDQFSKGQLSRGSFRAYHFELIHLLIHFRKMLILTMLTFWCLWTLGCMHQAISYAGETVQQETGETAEAETIEIKNQDDLVRWYENQTGSSSKLQIAVISKELVINEKILLGLPITDGNTGTRNSRQTPDQNLLQLKIQKEKDGTGGIIRIKGEGILIINDPKLFISGPDHLISVEDQGKLNLNQGWIKAENSTPKIPAIVCRNKAQQIVISDQFTEGKILEIGSLPDPAPPDESQSQPAPEHPWQSTDPNLTEALLLNINADGSGSAKLKFQNLPADIDALYIYRSEDGKSWTKDKKRVASSVQGSQNTVEYENFLKESGNILDRSIVEDEYLIYNFQSQNQSFYVKARIEWPGNAVDTPKIKVAIPDYSGQGLTFSYGWGGYGGGSYGSYGGGYDSYASGGGSYGQSSYNAGGGTEAETDAPEGPVRRGRGHSRDYYVPSTTQPVRPTSETTVLGETATPSNAKAASDSDADPSQIEETEGYEQAETVQEPELSAEEMQDETYDESVQTGAEDMNSRLKIQYIAAAAIIILTMVGSACYLLHRRKVHGRKK